MPRRSSLRRRLYPALLTLDYPSMHSRSDALLLASAPRSDHPDLAAAAAAASPNPNLETAAQPEAAAHMHRVTGTFEDPSHESTFAAQLFRMACPTRDYQYKIHN